VRAEPDLAKAVNLEASLNLIEAAREAGVRRLVFASTCSNYGQLRDPWILATEDHELRPVSLYAETKVAVERRLLEGPIAPLEAVVLRLGTLYGVSPRMRFDLTVNEFSMEMFVNRKLVVYGEGLWRPYVHVRDAARAIVTVLTASSDAVAGQVFNVGDSGQNFRKLDLVEIIRKRVGEVDVQFVHKAKDPRDFRVSFERIRERLGYTISRRVPDGVDEVIKAIGSGILDDLKNPFYYNVKP
jgi:nucleoside-diphosphate-sugar epimerase